jgi:hypothetical protein
MVNSRESAIATRLSAWITPHLLLNLMRKCFDGSWIVSAKFDCLNDGHSDTGLQQDKMGTIIMIDREW